MFKTHGFPHAIREQLLKSFCISTCSPAEALQKLSPSKKTTFFRKRKRPPKSTGLNTVTAIKIV